MVFLPHKHDIEVMKKNNVGEAYFLHGLMEAEQAIRSVLEFIDELRRDYENSFGAITSADEVERLHSELYACDFSECVHNVKVARKHRKMALTW